MKMKLNRKLKSREEGGATNPLRAVFTAVFTMFLISGLLLLLLALLLYKMEIEESVVRIGIIVIYILSGACGGFFLGKIQKERKYLWGLAAGALYFAILFLVSAATGGGDSMDMAKVATTFVLCAASGMAGGMVS